MWFDTGLEPVALRPIPKAFHSKSSKTASSDEKGKRVSFKSSSIPSGVVTFRVTRLAEFSSLWMIVYFGYVFENCPSSYL
jgi:hypothetical protein